MINYYEISENDAGQRIDRFIKKVTTNFPRSLMFKSFRNRLIRLNGQRVSPHQLLAVGDIVELRIYPEFLKRTINWNFLRVPSDINIVYEDEHILLVDKPVGLLTHGDSKGIQDTLLDRALHHLYNEQQFDPEKEQSFVPATVNRLDRNTQGIIIIAKSFPVLQVLAKKMRQQEIQRLYLAEVTGHVTPPIATLSGFHTKDAHKNLATITEHQRPNSRPVKTNYRVINNQPQSSILEIDLITGRSHQIRAHLAAIGHPLIGDTKYGYSGPQTFEQHLIAYKVCFNFQSDAGVLNYLKGQCYQSTFQFQ